MIESFQMLAAALLVDPELCIDDVPLVDDAQQKILLEEWNETAAEFDADGCWPQLFERQVERTPEAFALARSEEHTSESPSVISYAVFCLKKKKKRQHHTYPRRIIDPL